MLLYDILIYSDTFEDHIEHVRLVLDRLRTRIMALRFDKCEFCKTEVTYLGHIISREGRKADPGKVAAVKHMAPPTTKKQLRSFLGLASYLRKYVNNFSTVTHALTELTRDDVPEKDITPHWSPACTVAFEHIKQLLVEAPVLAHPDWSRPFIIETDASDYAVGAMLAQAYTDENGRTIHRPIAYASAKLNDAQRNYDVTSREGLAVVWSLHKFAHYLGRFPVTVITDHSPLATMQTRKHAAQRIERWRQIIQEFKPIFVYRKGRVNYPADALSRFERTDDAETLSHDFDRSIMSLTVANGSLDDALNAAASDGIGCTADELQSLPNWNDDAVIARWLNAQDRDETAKGIRDCLKEGKAPVGKARHLMQHPGMEFIIGPNDLL